MTDNNSDQNQKIFDQYNKERILTKETTDGMMRLKKKIESSKDTSVLSSRLVIKSLKENKLNESEEAVIEKFELLIRECSDTNVLNQSQLNAFEDIRDIQHKYINKE